MICPKCRNICSPKKVIRTWTLKSGFLKRKRRCLHCKLEFFTVERWAEDLGEPLTIGGLAK